MKIWTSSGSEHSMNLVIIGKFKTAQDAEKCKILIDSLRDFLHDHGELDQDSVEYGNDVLDFLSKKNISCIAPQQLVQFRYDMAVDLHENEIKITSDDDLNVFMALLIQEGAKVEAYSAHDYPVKDNA
jgi:hypothetical protein